ncbi:MAG: CoA ester lyase [Novosphingobium sp.]|nr:CoA ester lyase [Novosphingobium sp.]
MPDPDTIAAPIRSWLFAPGNHMHHAAKAMASVAHAVILDLEDAVAIAEKGAARADVRAALAQHRANRYVRINALSTPFAFDDVAAIMPGKPDGIMLPKTESADHVRILDWLLAQHERMLGLPEGTTQILPLLETARGVSHVDAIAVASRRVSQLAFGAGDFTLDLGLDWSRDEGELMSYRLAIVLASKAAGIHAPIDAAWVQVGDAEGMRSSARRSVDHGFQGKLCIHPSQVEIVHDAYRPDAAAIARASAIVAAFEDAEAAGSAAIAVAGKLVDYPIYESARRLLLDARRSAAENLA